MVDTDRLVEVIPHYVAMFVALFFIFGVVQRTYGETSLWIDIVVIVVVVFLYQALVRVLGVTPSSWERR